MYKFNRVYRLLIGKSGGKGVEIKPPLQIEFEIEKNTKPDPNIHRLKLYNLAPETIEAVSKPDGFCVLYAGYAEDEGEVLMAAGGVVDAYTYRDGTERITELTDYAPASREREPATRTALGFMPFHNPKEKSCESSKQWQLPPPPTPKPCLKRLSAP